MATRLHRAQPVQTPPPPSHRVARRPAICVLEAIEEQHPVRQTREGIVQRVVDEADLGLRWTSTEARLRAHSAGAPNRSYSWWVRTGADPMPSAARPARSSPSQHLHPAEATRKWPVPADEPRMRTDQVSTGTGIRTSRKTRPARNLTELPFAGQVRGPARGRGRTARRQVTMIRRLERRRSCITARVIASSSTAGSVRSSSHVSASRAGEDEAPTRDCVRVAAI